jgi:hypothetical protein
MYNQQFWQAEAEQRAQRLHGEAEADRRARAGGLRRRGAESLGKRMMSALGAQLSRRRDPGDRGHAGIAVLESAAGDALEQPETRSGAGSSEARRDLIAR